MTTIPSHKDNKTMTGQPNRTGKYPRTQAHCDKIAAAHEGVAKSHAHRAHIRVAIQQRWDEINSIRLKQNLSYREALAVYKSLKNRP